MRALELRIPPLAVVAAFAAAMAALTCVFPAGVFDNPVRLVAAFVLSALGVLAALAGVVAFRRHQTTVNPFKPEQSSALVSSGIYRFSRNPMYLGFLQALFGWGVYLSNWGAICLLPVFVGYMNRFQIRPEERALLERWGPEFTAYAARVRRWI